MAVGVAPNWAYAGSYRAADGIHLTRTGSLVFAVALRAENKNTVIP